MVPWRLGVKRGRRGSRKAAYFRQLTKTLMLLLINVGHQLTIIGIQNVLLTTTTDQLTTTERLSRGYVGLYNTMYNIS